MKHLFLIIIIIASHSIFGQKERWVEPSSIDTVLVFKNKTIQLKPTEFSDFDPYILSNELIDSLTQGIGNFYRKSKAIEDYLINSKFSSRVKRVDNELYVKLDNGDWFSPPLNSNYDETGHTFEHFFSEFGFYSVRVQWGEGNGYKLVSSKSGESFGIIGRPFFSPDGKTIIALGFDIEAGYSINGFQILQNYNGKMTDLGTYSPKNWGCVSAKWLSNQKLILKNQSYERSATESNYFNFFTELEIK